ncbi:MAG: trigger factor [bacterium]|nr:trigger factor [bacterium]
MKYTITKEKNATVICDVAFDHQEFLKYYQPIFDEARSQVQLKGFRPGGAPPELADKAVDKEKVFNEAVAEAVRVALREITQEKEMQVIDQPKIEVLESKEGLKFKATLSVFPEVTLSNYKKIAREIMEKRKKNPIVVDEKEIERSIEWVRNSRAKMTRVNREAKKGDVVDIDFSGSADGKALDGTSGKADHFVLGEGKFVSGFEENVIGHKEGDVVKFTVQFPKDYWKEAMREKKVDFEVKVHGVFERELPEMNDEFVKGIGKFETVADFKKSIAEGLTKEKHAKELEKARIEMLSEIAQKSSMDVPEVMATRTLESMVEEYKTYTKDTSYDEKTLRQKMQKRAEESVREQLTLYQIAKDEKLDPLPEEVEAEANAFLAHSEFKKKPDIDTKRLHDYAYGIVQQRKVFDFLESLS